MCGLAFATTGQETAAVSATAGDSTTGGASPAAIAGPLTPGQSFGPRYSILRLLGVGGMGAVYEAWDAELTVAVALKVIRIDPTRRVAALAAETRFKKELLLARQITHKNVVRIHDLGEIDGIKYITMPYLAGHDLATVLHREGKLPVERALRIARQIADGLEAAHDAGVVHRDLKPANVMIEDGDHAVIMDFGISVSSGEGSNWGFAGTLEYMAPEQSTGAAVDGRVDIYAFGLILYELLTGPRARSAATAPERFAEMRRRVADGVPAARSLEPSIPVALDALVTRCLARDPAERFATAADLVTALEALDEAGEPIRIPARISTRMAAGAAALVLVLLGAMFLVGRRLAPTPATAPEPVSILIADFENRTGDPIFNGTLEIILKLAVEGADFISAYDRSGLRRSLDVPPPERLDERTALEIAVTQGLGVVVSGAIGRQGRDYDVSVKTIDVGTKRVVTSARDTLSSRDQVPRVLTQMAIAIRQALGDRTSDSDTRFTIDTAPSSLEAVQDYAAGAAAMSASRFDDALRQFSRSAARDPRFGLAHAGMAIASRNLDRQQDAEKYMTEALQHLGMGRERYRVRGLYYFVTGDDQQCVNEFEELVARYPADPSARNNLALCLTYLRQLPRAVDQLRQALKLMPKRRLYRENLAIYADYSGDFQAAEQEARAIPQPSMFGLLALAFAQLGQGQLARATETFKEIGNVDALGRSYAASGAGDMALYEGRLPDAVRILAEGARDDLVSKNLDRAANKFAALAHVQLARRRSGDAIASAETALANSNVTKIRFLAARVFIEAGADARARTLAAELATAARRESQTYSKILDGEVALKRGDAGQAIALLTEANGRRDTWIGHFDLGRAYLEAGAFAQAESEFALCVKRRGEALALFLDEEPTYGMFPPVLLLPGTGPRRHA